MQVEMIKSKLKEKVSEKRYRHILGVEKTAIELAKIYGVSTVDAKLAALLHDYAKQMPIVQMQEICKEYFFEETKEYLDQGELLHGYVGAHLAESEFGIKNKEILEAIKYHTTGRRNLGLLAKIIYIADAIEPGRDYPGVDELREIVKKDIDGALLEEVDRKLKYLLKLESIIHLNSVDMRNWIIELKRKGEKDEIK